LRLAQRRAELLADGGEGEGGGGAVDDARQDAEREQRPDVRA
jgi:hypothetical protein